MACSIWQHIQTFCQRSECSIHLQWIPGHAGLAGNEEVDSIAKQAAALTQIDTPIDFSTAKAVIHRSTRAKWKREAKPKLPFAQPPSHQLEASLSRQDRRLLSQLRTGGKSPKLKYYLHKIAPAENPDPSCRACREEDETMDHVFLRCPATYRTRRRLLGHFRDPRSALFKDPRVTVEFLRAVGIADHL